MDLERLRQLAEEAMAAGWITEADMQEINQSLESHGKITVGLIRVYRLIEEHVWRGELELDPGSKEKHS